MPGTNEINIAASAVGLDFNIKEPQKHDGLSVNVLVEGESLHYDFRTISELLTRCFITLDYFLHN